jgi:signal transduction histidine kinase
VRTSTRPVAGNTGEPTFFGIISDISREKQAEDAIRQANRKLKLLSSITRHDMNNQLLVLNGFLNLLHKKVKDEELEDFFTKIRKASSRISSMIQFTREYEEIGVTAPTWQECRELVDTAAKEAPLGQVTLKNDLAAGVEVLADPLISKVCYNLMDNATRYGVKITTICFSAMEQGDDLIVVCEDDGEGVPANEKEKIFERGFGKNTGLGLALSREILAITGITIAETGEPGKGARFEMTVPKGMWGTGGKKE